MKSEGASADPENPFEVAGDLNVMRTWTDSSGKFSVEAQFVSLTDGVVTLKRKDGKEVRMMLDKLSKADVEIVKKLGAAK
jgi:hypothetical protein